MRRFIQKLENRLWETGITGRSHSSISQDERGSKATGTWDQVNDPPLLEGEDEGPAVLWRGGLPLLIRYAEFGLEPSNEITPNGRSRSQGRCYLRWCRLLCFADEGIGNVHRAASIPGKSLLNVLNHNSTQREDVAGEVRSGDGESEGGRSGGGTLVRLTCAAVLEGVAVGQAIRDANVLAAGVGSGEIAEERGRDQMCFGGVGRRSLAALIVLAEESDFAVGYCLAGRGRPCGRAAGAGWAGDRSARSDREVNASVLERKGRELELVLVAGVVIS